MFLGRSDVCELFYEFKTSYNRSSNGKILACLWSQCYSSHYTNGGASGIEEIVPDATRRATHSCCFRVFIPSCFVSWLAVDNADKHVLLYVLVESTFRIMKQSFLPNSLQKLSVNWKCPAVPPDRKPSFLSPCKFQSKAYNLSHDHRQSHSSGQFMESCVSHVYGCFFRLRMCHVTDRTLKR